nr:hypothetical protein [Streptomyces sp. HUCO-GS316]
MAAFLAAKERFAVRLRPEDVRGAAAGASARPFRSAVGSCCVRQCDALVPGNESRAPLSSPPRPVANWRRNGNQVVPTVVFADGTAMTNPGVLQVKEHLAKTA